MIKRKQLFRHKPEQGTYGDCHRTCIACLLDIEPEQVPHWGMHYGDSDKFLAASQDYLATQGLTAVQSWVKAESLEQLLDTQALINPDVYYLLTGQSKNGCNHVVICLNDKIIHDPSLDDSGIIGPCDGDKDGWYWIDYLVPLRFTTKTEGKS